MLMEAPLTKMTIIDNMRHIVNPAGMLRKQKVETKT